MRLILLYPPFPGWSGWSVTLLMPSRSATLTDPYGRDLLIGCTYGWDAAIGLATLRIAQLSRAEYSRHAIEREVMLDKIRNLLNALTSPKPLLLIELYTDR